MKASADPRSRAERELGVLARWRELDVAGEPVGGARARRSASSGSPRARRGRRTRRPAGARPRRRLRALRDDARLGRRAAQRSRLPLPGIELAVARELGLHSKAQIECHGIGALNARCRASALARAAQHDALGERVAVQSSPG